MEYYYYKLLLMCNFTRAESYMDIEVVNLLNQLYRDKGKVSGVQLKEFVALMQANIFLEWKGTGRESQKAISLARALSLALNFLKRAACLL